MDRKEWVNFMDTKELLVSMAKKGQLNSMAKKEPPDFHGQKGTFFFFVEFFGDFFEAIFSAKISVICLKQFLGRGM